MSPEHEVGTEWGADEAAFCNSCVVKSLSGVPLCFTRRGSQVRILHRPPFYFQSKFSIRKTLPVCASITMDRTPPFIYGLFMMCSP